MLINLQRKILFRVTTAYRMNLQMCYRWSITGVISTDDLIVGDWEEGNIWRCKSQGSTVHGKAKARTIERKPGQIMRRQASRSKHSYQILQKYKVYGSKFIQFHRLDYFIIQFLVLVNASTESTSIESKRCWMNTIYVVMRLMPETYNFQLS